MAKIYDEEDLLLSIRDYVKTNLNTQITAINTEKNDDYSIDTITAENRRYVIAGELLDLPNHTFVNFAIDGDIITKSNYDQKVAELIINIEVAFEDSKKAGTYYKSLRYMRALYETILKYATSTNEVDDLIITKAIPMVINTRERRLVVSGVSVSVSLS